MSLEPQSIDEGFETRAKPRDLSTRKGDRQEDTDEMVLLMASEFEVAFGSDLEEESHHPPPEETKADYLGKEYATIKNARVEENKVRRYIRGK